MSRRLSSVNPSSCGGRYESGDDCEDGGEEEAVDPDEVKAARESEARNGRLRRCCPLTDAKGRRCMLLPGHLGACSVPLAPQSSLW